MVEFLLAEYDAVAYLGAVPVLSKWGKFEKRLAGGALTY